MTFKEFVIKMSSERWVEFGSFQGDGSMTIRTAEFYEDQIVRFECKIALVLQAEIDDNKLWGVLYNQIVQSINREKKKLDGQGQDLVQHKGEQEAGD